MRSAYTVWRLELFGVGIPNRDRAAFEPLRPGRPAWRVSSLSEGSAGGQCAQPIPCGGWSFLGSVFPTVIAQHSSRFDPGDRHGALVRYRKVRQGDNALSLYRVEVGAFWGRYSQP